MVLPNPFPLARLRLRTVVERPVRWPEYEGSALRGLWGHALREQVCATGRPHCDGCPLQMRCCYPALFEPTPPTGARTYGDMTPPYVIEPGRGARTLDAGQTYVFHQVLFGQAAKDWPVVVAAWQRAFARRLGLAQGMMRLLDAQWADGSMPPTSDFPRGLVWRPASTAPARVRMIVLTPIYLKRGGHPLKPSQLTATDIAWAAVRRVAEVCELHLGQSTGLDFAALKAAAQSLRLEASDFRVEHYRRWSNRQQRHTPLTGFVGSAILAGDLAPFWPVLQIGQYLHIGGKTSFGLGAYELRPADPTNT